MRVLVVDDHEVVRRGVKSLLLSQSDYDVCGEAVDGNDALEKASHLRPDIIVMDVSMPKLNGLEATRLIRTRLPDAEVLILSQHESAEMVRQAFKAGARGYVVKSSISRDLLNALDNVSRHQPFFDPAIPGVSTRSPQIDAQEILQRSAALEKALRKSEELYRSTFEFAELGVAHQSPEGRWLNVNNKLCRIVGYSKEELLKMTYQDITHPDDIESDLAQIEQMRFGLSETYSTEKRYIRKDGSQIWVSLKVSAVRDHDRALQYFVTVVEDITGRREAERAKFRLAAIVESSNDAIISKDLTGIITSWNSGAVLLFGYKSEEVIGQSITVIIPPELRGEEAEILRRMAKGERIEHFDTVRITKAGHRVNVSLTISPIKDSNGHIIGVSKIARDITERKYVGRQVEQNEERTRFSLEAANVGTWDWDLSSDQVHWSANMEALHGQPPGSFGGSFESFLQGVHPEDQEKIRKQVELALADGGKFRVEYRQPRPDGSVASMEGTGRVIYDALDRPVRMFGVSLDITERKRTQEALQRNEQQFRIFADFIPELCWMAHPNGEVFWYNQRWLDYTGTRLEQMQGSGWEVVHDPKILPEVKQRWQKSIQTGQPFEMVFPLRAADGTFRPFLTRVKPLKDENDRVLRWFGINIDIASQKQHEDALRESEARLRAAFSQTYSFLVLLTPDGTVIEANHAALEIAGRKREEILGCKFWEPWWSKLPEELAALRKSVARAGSGERVREECYFTLADGSRRFAHRTLDPVLDQHGKVVMIVATGLDLTEQKELRDKLEARVKQRTHELEAKNQVLLQQELTVRELSGQLLRAQDEERRRIARELHDSAGQIVAALHMNLLPLEASAHDLDPKIVNGIKQSIEFVEQLSSELRTISYLLHPPLLDEAGLPSALRWYVEGFAERSNIQVQLELSPDLGRLPPDMEVTLFRMVQECLTNIHRHSESDKASIRLKRSTEEVSLEIQDNGKGMSVSNNGHSSPRPVRAGVGIQGMRERVRQLHGQFDIHSEKTGTLVSARLPLTKAALAS